MRSIVRILYQWPKFFQSLGVFLLAATLGICLYPSEAAAFLQLAAPEANAPIAQQHVIRVSSNLITVPVSVTDADGNAVKDLDLKDFAIDEDGQPVAIAKIAEPGQTPLALMLLYDISGSVSSRFDFEKETATHFLNAVVRPGDTVSVITIGPQPEILQQPTGDLSIVLQSLTQLKPTRGMTGFYDAIVTAAQFLSKIARADARRVQIAISDGEDNNSEANKLIDALREIQRADCIFYSINPAGASVKLNMMSAKGQDGMQELATETGGAAFVPETNADFNRMFERIATELRAQYLLVYYAANVKSDGAFHKISVKIPNRPELRIRARQGYYAATAAATAAPKAAPKAPAKTK
jgi:Ca-activated chloride channel homolog